MGDSRGTLLLASLVPCKNPLLLKSHSCAFLCRDWGEPKPPSLRCLVPCVHDESGWPEALLAAWHSTHYKDIAAVAAVLPLGNTQFRIETSLLETRLSSEITVKLGLLYRPVGPSLSGGSLRAQRFFPLSVVTPSVGSICPWSALQVSKCTLEDGWMHHP